MFMKENYYANQYDSSEFILLETEIHVYVNVNLLLCITLQAYYGALFAYDNQHLLLGIQSSNICALNSLICLSTYYSS